MIRYNKPYVIHNAYVLGALMKLLIVGSRSIKEYELDQYVPSEVH